MKNDDDVHDANPDLQLFAGPDPLKFFAGPAVLTIKRDE